MVELQDHTRAPGGRQLSAGAPRVGRCLVALGYELEVGPSPVVAKPWSHDPCTFTFDFLLKGSGVYVIAVQHAPGRKRRSGASYKRFVRYCKRVKGARSVGIGCLYIDETQLAQLERFDQRAISGLEQRIRKERRRESGEKEQVKEVCRPSRKRQRQLGRRLGQLYG